MTHFNLDQHLQEVLESHSQSRIQDKIQKFHEVRQEVADFLKEKFPVGTFLADEPLNTGSYAKGTEVNKHFDLDLLFPFLYRENGPQEIRDDIYRALQERYQRSKIHVRNQKVTVGLKIPFQGEDLEIDVIPAMEIQRGAFQKGPGNLHGKDILLWDRFQDLKFKTNIHKQIKTVQGAGMETQRRIMRLLKVFNKHMPEGSQPTKPLKSFTTELLVLDAFKNGNLPDTHDLGQLLKSSLSYLDTNIHNLSLTDPGTDRKVKGQLLGNPKEQEEVRNLLSRLKKSLELAPHTVPDLLPINTEVPKPDTKESPKSYGGTSYA